MGMNGVWTLGSSCNGRDGKHIPSPLRSERGQPSGRGNGTPKHTDTDNNRATATATTTQHNTAQHSTMYHYERFQEVQATRMEGFPGSCDSSSGEAPHIEYSFARSFRPGPDKSRYTLGGREILMYS